MLNECQQGINICLWHAHGLHAWHEWKQDCNAELPAKVVRSSFLKQALAEHASKTESVTQTRLCTAEVMPCYTQTHSSTYHLVCSGKHGLLLHTHAARHF